MNVFFILSIFLSSFDERSSSESSSPAISCEESCSEPLESFFKHHYLDKLETGIFNPELYDEEVLESTCGAYKDWKKCLEKCEKSFLIKIIEKVHSLFASLCENDKKDYIAYLDCFDASFDKQDKTCTPLCGGKKGLENTIHNLVKATEEKQLIQVARMVEEGCKVFACHFNCTIPIILESCQDEQAAHFMVKAVTKTIGNELQGLMDMGMVLPTCAAVLNNSHWEENMVVEEAIEDILITNNTREEANITEVENMTKVESEAGEVLIHHVMIETDFPLVKHQKESEETMESQVSKAEEGANGAVGMPMLKLGLAVFALIINVII